MNVPPPVRRGIVIASGAVVGGAVAGAISSPVLGPSDRPLAHDLVKSMYVGGIGLGVLGLVSGRASWAVASLTGVGVGAAYTLAKSGVDQLSS